MDLTDPFLVPFTLSFGSSPHARKRVGQTIARHPVAAPGATPGPAVDLVQLVHLAPLLHVHQTPPLGLIATTAVIDIERETMTVRVDHHHHHHHRIPLVEIFPP